MTFPGAETMKGGIMGDDGFLRMASRIGSVAADMLPANWADDGPVGEASDAWLL